MPTLHQTAEEPLLRLERYADAWDRLAVADLVLFRAEATPVDMAIAGAGRSRYCHAAMLDYTDDSEWRMLETLQWHGGREVSLLDQVQRFPGHYDVFRPNPENRWPWFEPELAIAHMRTFVGRRYGWLHLVRLALGRLPLLSFVLPLDRWADVPDGQPPFCSEACAAAYAAGGVDPVPLLSDRRTEPGDLARSLFFEYRFTLVP